jgi:hypothetical protein
VGNRLAELPNTGAARPQLRLNQTVQFAARSQAFLSRIGDQYRDLIRGALTSLEDEPPSRAKHGPMIRALIGSGERDSEAASA